MEPCDLAPFARTQTILARSIVERECEEPSLVAGVDVSYGEKAYASCVVCSRDMRVVEQRSAVSPVYFPYVPTFFSFRECPPILKVVRDMRFDMLFVHGHGRAHPRLFGLACHAGLILKKPTVGVAHGLICGVVEEGCIVYKGQVVGKVFGRNVVSVGNLTTLSQAFEYALRFSKNGIPFPVGMAHIFAERLKKSEFE